MATSAPISAADDLFILFSCDFPNAHVAMRISEKFKIVSVEFLKSGWCSASTDLARSMAGELLVVFIPSLGYCLFCKIDAFKSPNLNLFSFYAYHCSPSLAEGVPVNPFYSRPVVAHHRSVVGVFELG